LAKAIKKNRIYKDSKKVGDKTKKNQKLSSNEVHQHNRQYLQNLLMIKKVLTRSYLKVITKKRKEEKALRKKKRIKMNLQKYKYDLHQSSKLAKVLATLQQD